MSLDVTCHTHPAALGAPDDPSYFSTTLIHSIVEPGVANSPKRFSLSSGWARFLAGSRSCTTPQMKFTVCK